jgi:CRP-like cAMP-binding protein
MQKMQSFRTLSVDKVNIIAALKKEAEMSWEEVSSVFQRPYRFDSMPIKRWRATISLLCCWSLLFEPIVVGVQLEMGVGLCLVEAMTVAALVLDIWVVANTTYYTRGQLITAPRVIRHNYLQSIFLLDLIAALPVAFILLACGKHSTPHEYQNYFLFLRFLRLTKSYRLEGFFNMLSESSLASSSVARMIFCAYGYCVITNAIAFSLLVLFRSHPIDSHDTLGPTAADPYQSEDGLAGIVHNAVQDLTGNGHRRRGGGGGGSAAAAAHGAGAVHHEEFRVPGEDDQIGRYIACLYLACKTLGLAMELSLSHCGLYEAYALTVYERAFLLALVFVMLFVYGAFYGTIGDIVINAVKERTEFRYRQHLCNSVLQRHRLPAAIQRKCDYYFAYIAMRKVGFRSLDKLLRGLPRACRNEVNISYFLDMISKVCHALGLSPLLAIVSAEEPASQVPMFAHTDPSFVISLVQRLHSIVYLPDDVILKAGDVGETMYFICEGAVAVVGVNESTLAEFIWRVLDPGQYFGEIALVMQNCVRTATVRAMRICELAELSKKDFDVLMDIYPLQFQQIKIIMEDRLRAYAERNKPSDKKQDGPGRVTSHHRRAGAIQAEQDSSVAAKQPPGKRRSLIDMAANQTCTAMHALTIPAAAEAPAAGEVPISIEIADQALSGGGDVPPDVRTDSAAAVPAPEPSADPTATLSQLGDPMLSLPSSTWEPRTPHTPFATDPQSPENVGAAPLETAAATSARRRSIAERRGSKIVDTDPLVTPTSEPATPGPQTFMTEAQTDLIRKREEALYTPDALERRRSRSHSISVAPQEFGLGPPRAQSRADVAQSRADVAQSRADVAQSRANVGPPRCPSLRRNC